MSENTIGTQGAQGTEGMQGPQGAQGRIGLQGAQGAQGARGNKGAQGITGAKGEQGDYGKQGPQGSTGLRGKQGAQGTRGCDGAQGAAGMTGSQGAQGIKGRAGAQGTRGCDGVQGPVGMDGLQGAQGAKGRAGAQGTMGYQGDTGEVGIQGLVGADGAIWDDGIRLSGYNTHLFDYNVSQNKYISRNTKTNSIGETIPADILYLRDGSVLKIWLNDDAYESIHTTNKIRVDSTYPVDGTMITSTTEYPVYYTADVLLGSVINPDTDIDTVIELTYRNEGWYYSGGLITPTITDEIEVTGVTLGNLTDGSKIAAGTTIQELFEKMFKKEINPKVGALPKLSISFTNNIGTVEVGSSVSNSISKSYTDGYFESSDKTNYPDSKFNTENKCTGGKLNAGCEEGTITYKVNGETMDSNVISIDSVSETDYTYTASETYSASTVVPKSNVGNEIESVSISAGNASASTIKIQGRFKYFYGIQTEVIQDNVDKEEYFQFKTQSSLSDLSYGYLDNLYETTIDKIQSSELKKSFAIVIPTNWDIIQTKNNMGTSLTIDTTWFKQNTIEYTIGDVTTTYQVYVLPSTLVTEYQDIILTKHTN